MLADLRNAVTAVAQASWTEASLEALVSRIQNRRINALTLRAATLAQR